MDYMINPVKMGGLVKEIINDAADGAACSQIKVHLHGRLGVLTVPEALVIHREALEAGQKVEFYFSYIQIVEDVYDYDSTEMRTQPELSPCLLGGVVTEVNDTAVKVAVMDGLGTVAAPRRWVFTPVTLKVGLKAEFYFSRMKVVGSLC